MATLTINGKSVTVDASFANLTPEQQEATVNEIAAQIGAAAPQQQAAPTQSATPPAMSALASGAPFASVAFGDQMVESVPIAGPWLKDQLQGARAGLAQGIEALPEWVPGIGGYKAPTREQLDQFTQAAVDAHPVASVAGQGFGTVAPLAGAGLIPGVSRALGMSGGLLSQLGFGIPTGMAINAADTAARGGDMQDITQAGAIGGGVAAAVPLVGRGIGALLGRGVSREAKNLGRALTDDGVDPATINQQLADLGDDAMVMDLGPNLQSQAGALASVPGQAQKTLRAAIQARTKDASKRVQGDLAATVGTGPEIGQMTEQIIQAQKTTAKPLYDAVRNVPVQPKGNILFVMRTPMGKKAFADAAEMAANDGMPAGGTLTVGLLDYAKQALDDIGTSAARAGNNNVARQAAQMAKLLTKEADAIAPAYAQARAAFSGPAKVLEAIELGQTILSKDMSPGQLQSKLSAMSPSEMDGILQSFRASLEAQLGNAVNDALSLRNALKKGWNEQKLRILLGDDVADDMMKRINREAVFGDTSGVVTRNAETARRTASQEEIAPDLRRIEPAGGLALLFRAINDARAKIMGNIHGKSNQRLAQALASGQMSPKVLSQAKRAMAPKGRLPIPASAIPMLPAPDTRRPVDITIYGGN